MEQSDSTMEHEVNHNLREDSVEPEANPFALPESPAALKQRLREAEAELVEAQRRLLIAQQNVSLAETDLREAGRAYTEALETALEDRGQSRVLLQSRKEAEDELLDMDVMSLLKKLDSVADSERLAAENEMRSLGFRAVGPLLRIMEREAMRRDRWSMVVAGVAVFAIVLSFLGVFMGVSGGGEPLYVILLILLLSLVNTTRPTKLQKRAAQQLANYDDARVIGPLADGLELSDNYTRSIASAGLRRLMRRVRASDAVHVSKDHLGKLYRALGSEDQKLILAILQGLEQIGDEDAVAHVEKLANRPAVSEMERKIRAAARECLPALHARLRDNPGATLLRAAYSPADESEGLLRSAAITPDANPEILLRSVGEAD